MNDQPKSFKQEVTRARKQRPKSGVARPGQNLNSVLSELKRFQDAHSLLSGANLEKEFFEQSQELFKSKERVGPVLPLNSQSASKTKRPKSSKPKVYSSKPRNNKSSDSRYEPALKSLQKERIDISRLLLRLQGEKSINDERLITGEMDIKAKTKHLMLT